MKRSFVCIILILLLSATIAAAAPLDFLPVFGGKKELRSAPVRAPDITARRDVRMQRAALAQQPISEAPEQQTPIQITQPSLGQCRIILKNNAEGRQVDSQLVEQCLEIVPKKPSSVSEAPASGQKPVLTKERCNELIKNPNLPSDIKAECQGLLQKSSMTAAECISAIRQHNQGSQTPLAELQQCQNIISSNKEGLSKKDCWDILELKEKGEAFTPAVLEQCRKITATQPVSSEQKSGSSESVTDTRNSTTSRSSTGSFINIPKNSYTIFNIILYILDKGF